MSNDLDITTTAAVGLFNDCNTPAELAAVFKPIEAAFKERSRAIHKAALKRFASLVKDWKPGERVYWYMDSPRSWSHECSAIFDSFQPRAKRIWFRREGTKTYLPGTSRLHEFYARDASRRYFWLNLEMAHRARASRTEFTSRSTT